MGTFALLQLTLKIKFSRCFLFYFNRVWSLNKWSHVQNILQQLQNWARCNCMSIHHVKTEIVFVRRSLLDQICLSPKKIIRLTVYLTLSLGVTLGNKHCWSTHIKAITANFNAKLNKLEQIWPHDLRNYLFLKYITQCNLLYFSMGLSKLITWSGRLTHPCCSSYS